MALAGLQWPGCTPQVLSHWGHGWPTSLDWGLYWFSIDGQVEKSDPGKASSFFDPANKTVIFFHGWQGEHEGSTPYCYRPTPYCDPDVCSDNRLMMQAWFLQGWNVGFFYWDQFADEPCTRDAEQKIWFDKGDSGLRWASYDVKNEHKSYLAFPARNASLTDLCVQEVENVLVNFTGSSLRFVGHDIGAQLAASCGVKLHELERPVKPTRLTMLDPIFTERHLGVFRCHKVDIGPGMGDFAAEATSKAVEGLWMRAVPTEVFKSSELSENAHLNNPNSLLNEISLMTEYNADWCNQEYAKIMHWSKNWACRHKAALLQYFDGKGGAPPELVGVGLQSSQGRIYAMPGACLTPSAACTDEETTGLARTQEKARNVKHKDVSWKQVEGQWTQQTNDDKYSLNTAVIDVGEALSLPTAPPRPPRSSSGAGQAGQMPAPPVTDVASGGAKDGRVPGSSRSADEATDSGSLRTRFVAMPHQTQLLVLTLGIVGFSMLCYGLQPVVVNLRRPSRDLRWGRFESVNSMGSESSSEGEKEEEALPRKS